MWQFDAVRQPEVERTRLQELEEPGTQRIINIRRNTRP